MIADLSDVRLCIIGMGYVGLPLAVEFGKKIPTIGFDINESRINSLKNGIDVTMEVSANQLAESCHLNFTSDSNILKSSNVFIVTVPTPIDANRKPDLTPLLLASELVGKKISPNSVVIFESTVYPGATQDDCVPIIEKFSGLKCDVDFFGFYIFHYFNPKL